MSSEPIKFSYERTGISIEGLNLNDNGLPWFENIAECDDWSIRFDSIEDFLLSYVQSSDEVKKLIIEKLLVMNENLNIIVQEIQGGPKMKVLEVNDLQLPTTELALKKANEFAHMAVNVGFPFDHNGEIICSLLRVSKELVKRTTDTTCVFKPSPDKPYSLKNVTVVVEEDDGTTHVYSLDGNLSAGPSLMELIRKGCSPARYIIDMVEKNM